MKNFFIKILIAAAAVALTSCLFPRVFVNRVTIALLSVFILPVLNCFVKLITVNFTLPITVTIDGIFHFIISAIIILFLGKFVAGFREDAAVWALPVGLLLFLPDCSKLLLNQITRRSNIEYAF